MATSPRRTPWLLIEICCELSLFRDMPAGTSSGWYGLAKGKVV
jgi:hypothetical protein